MGQQQIGNLSLGVFGVAVLDYSARNPVVGFQQPSIDVFRSVGGDAGSEAFDASAFASRLIVGAVFGFLIFITIVIYRMWVAQGVVAEKASRVMELLVSAASTRQLVIGKALGIGLAGATKTTIVLAPFACPRDGGGDRPAAARPGGRLRVVALGALAGAAARFRGVLRPRLRAVLAGLRRGRVARQPAGGPPDHRPAAEHRRDRRVRNGPPGADRWHHRLHPARLVRPVLEPVRDADPAVGRAGRAVGARAVGVAADRDDPRHERRRDPDLRGGRAALRPAAGLRAYVLAARGR